MLNQPDSRITHSKKAKEAQNAKKPDKAKLNKRSKDLDNFTFARINLLVLACLTLLNLAFLAFGLDISLLFSAIIPYFSMFLGVEYINAGMPLGWICIILAAAICAFYLFCYVYSKKNPIWLKAAFICFLPDSWLCVYLLLMDFDLTGILSTLFMLWMLFCFISGIVKESPNGREQEVKPTKEK